MQNLEPLLIFITVADMGSFTLAADRLGIQKGRASTAVRKLEEDVGVRLLHRTTRSVQLTISTQCSQAIAWHFAGVCASIFRPKWHGQRSCRPYRISWRLIPSWSWRCRARIAKLIWFKRGLTAYCDWVPSETRR